MAIDADGVRLDLPAESVSTLPHIQLSDGDGDAGLASKNLQTIFSALDEGTRGQIITISVDKNQQFTLTLANSVQIFWGTSDDSVLKGRSTASLAGRTGHLHRCVVAHLPGDAVILRHTPICH